MSPGMLGMFFLAVLYLQRVLGYDAVATGAAFLPISLTIGVLSLGFSARLITRFGAARRAAARRWRSIAAGLALLCARAGRRPLLRRRPARDARCSASAAASRSRR